MSNPVDKIGKIQKISVKDLEKKPSGQTFDIQKLIDQSHKVAVIQKEHEERDNPTGK